MRLLSHLFCGGLALASLPCFAGWPTFSVPSPSEVQALVQVAGCPRGEGRIAMGAKLPIVNHYIPPDQRWYWQVKGNEQCHRLTSDLHYVRFYQTGNRAGHEIEADYGTTRLDILYRFVFPITGMWDCGALYPGKLPEDIGCAMDTLSYAP